MKRSFYSVPAITIAVFFMVLLVRGLAGPFSVFAIGDFAVGGPAPDKPGDEIVHPYGVIPPSRFYVYLWQPGIQHAQCVYEECGRGGEIVSTLRGWLWGSSLDSDSELWLAYHNLPLFLKSLIVIADADSTIVGIYPNAQLFDLEKILKKYPDLADFGMLKGVRMLGPIAVGAPLPFKPTDMFEHVQDAPQRIPRFYVYAVHETWAGFYCPYYECGVYIDAVYTAGGAFDAFDHDNPEIIRKLGLSPSQVARGEITLVVVAGSDGTVLSIHPNKDMRDIMTILTQHPDVADVKKLYPHDTPTNSSL